MSSPPSTTTAPRPLLGMIIACHPGPTIAVTTAVTAYAALEGRTGRGVALVGCAVLCGQLTTGWQNDAIDATIDRAVARADKPIPKGMVARRTVAVGAIVAAVSCVILSYASGWRAGTAHTVAVGLAASYNAGVKKTALSIVPYVGAFALLPCFVTLGAPRAPWPPWAVPTGVALLGAAAHILNVLPDAESDRRSGLRSFPLRLPLPVAWTSSAVLLVGSCGLLAFGAHTVQAGTIAAFVTCVALGIGATVAGARRSPWGFRLACVVAVADVGLLAASRH